MIAPYYEDTAVVLYHGDCREILPQLAPVDVVITDPPYDRHVGTNLPGKHGKLKDGHERIRDLGYDGFDAELIAITAPHMVRIAQRWLVVFNDVESAPAWRTALVDAGARYMRTGAWVREGTSPQFSGDRPAVGFEALTICHGAEERLRWNGGGHAAVWQFPIVHAAAKQRAGGHSTPKPLELMTRLVAQFSDPGKAVLDPFAGSGTTLRAAKDLGRKAIGIELNEQHCESIAVRMSQEVLPLTDRNG